MPKQTLNNGESNLVIRTKINENFTEVYESLESNQASLEQIETELESKADQTSLDTTNAAVALKAPQSTVDSITTQLSTLASQIGSSGGLNFANTNVSRSISVSVDESIIGQDYLGGYIEIQPDSWDGTLPSTDAITNTWGFPISLKPTERKRVKENMFSGSGKGIMFIRLPLGFAYRGYRNIDSGTGLAKNIGERYTGQNAVLKAWFDRISESGGGLAPEYWCPAPFWVTSGSYSSANQLRAGGSYSMATTLASIKGTDATQYNAQISAFTDAIVNDLEYLHQNIAPVRMFSLQNEPGQSGMLYGSCTYDAQTYNDVLTVAWTKILASSILSTYNSEPNVIKLLVASSVEANPFGGIAATYIANHASSIWGYTHHMTQSTNGEAYADGAEFYKTTTYSNIIGSKTNVFNNEYEYFSTTFGTDDFRCSNNILRLINEAVYGKAQVLHPVIHICKPVGQTMSDTNTRGYCLFEVNLDGSYGIDPLHANNTHRLNRGCVYPNKSMYNAWAAFNDNLPVGAYRVGSYSTQIAKAGYCVYKYNNQLYLFFANNSSQDASITVTFSASKVFNGKMYSMAYCGDAIKQKSGTTIEFVIPAYSGQAWTEAAQSTGTVVVVNNVTPSVSSSFSTSSFMSGANISIPYTVTDSDSTSFTATYTIDGTPTTATVGVSSNTWAVGTGLSVGSHTLKIKVSDGTTTSNELSFSITVTSANVSVTGVSVSPSSPSIVVGSTQQLTASIVPSNATNTNVTWSSNNTSVATVNSSGLVTAVAAGSATITCTTADGSFTGTSSITVTASNVSATGVSVSPNTASISAGNTQQLTATVSPSNATNKTVNWSSNNTAVATVNSSGLVTGESAGSATITATTVDGSITSTSAITVTASAQTTLFSDSFNRADNNTTLGTPDIGSATWTYDSGIWGISGNKAKVISFVSSTSSSAFVDIGNKDVDITCDFTYNNYSSLVLRQTDVHNQYRLRLSSAGLGLFKVITDTPTSIGSYAITPVVGTVYTLRAVLSGSSIKIYLNGTLVIDITDSTYLTQTKFGIYTGTSNTSEMYDNFVIKTAT